MMEISKIAAYSGAKAVELKQSNISIDEFENLSGLELPEGGSGLPVRATSKTVFDKSSGVFYRTYKFSVKLDPDSEERTELHGELATTQDITANTTVQVLVAGGSNNGIYWDWPMNPEVHSYVRYATKMGFVTLNLDRPGYGKSDRPNPELMDFATQGYMVGQVIDQLKQGALGHKFSKIVLNGHSMGGMVAWHCASKHHGADAVIVSGVGHNLSEEAMRIVRAAVQPIENHPGYGRGMGWEPGYFARTMSSKVPESAVDLFTLLLQDTVMIAELNTMERDSKDYSITENIRVPVLFALGQYDKRWCVSAGECSLDPVFLNESKYYSPEIDFTSFIVPQAGHLINKDPGAPIFFQAVSEWLQKRGF
ncbi:alpha/beta hydrolase [Cupriavidus campinensis]